jgi:hypothetical protein
MSWREGELSHTYKRTFQSSDIKIKINPETICTMEVVIFGSFDIEVSFKGTELV